MDILQKQIVSILRKYSCYFYIITIGIMSDNTESQVMLYFTDEVFRRLANQNRGHGIFYKAGLR